MFGQGIKVTLKIKGKDVDAEVAAEKELPAAIHGMLNRAALDYAKYIIAHTTAHTTDKEHEDVRRLRAEVVYGSESIPACERISKHLPQLKNILPKGGKFQRACYSRMAKVEALVAYYERFKAGGSAVEQLSAAGQ